MKAFNVKRRSQSQLPKVLGARALVETWEQEPNAFHSTTVVYEIAVRARTFAVRGIDESDKTALKISDVTWSGKQLRFLSLYPPTGHRASHVFQLTEEDCANHTVTYSDEEGKWTSKEKWRKRIARGSKRR